MNADQDTFWLAQYYTHDKCADGDEENDQGNIPLSPSADGKYALTGDVGEGGMKLISRASDRDTKRAVAIATIKDGEISPRRLRRFVREARITAQLEHPNIVPVYDVGVDQGGKPYFTMKLLQGESLSEVLRRLADGDANYERKYPLSALLGIFQHVCNAIGFAHSKGVLHLDLKPSNIRVNDFGEALVIDWGLARQIGEREEPVTEDGLLLEAGVEATSDGVIKGTPGYMAPEQARGANSVKDERTDIYSLGAILYSILTLMPPVDTELSAREAVEATARGTVLEPSLRAPERGVPPPLEAIAMKALSAPPRQRYQRVEDLRRDIQAYSEGFAVSAQDPSLMTLFWLLLKRHKTGSVMTLGALAVIVGLTAAFIHHLQLSKEEAVTALAQLQAEQQAKQEYGLLAAPRVLTRAVELYTEGNLDDAAMELDLAVALDPKSEDAWMYKGFSHLGRCEFPEAIAAFERSSPRANRYLDLARECSAWTLASDGNLSAEQADSYLELFNESTPRRTPRLHEKVRKGLVRQLLTGPACSAASLDSRMETLKRQLRFYNPNQKRINMRHSATDGGLSLRLSNNDGLKDISLLRGLPLVSLDISHTAVIWLNALEGMQLEFLDISHTQVDNLDPLQGMPLKILRLQELPDLQIDPSHYPQLEKVVR